IRVTWARPIGMKGFAMWDWGQMHMECWGEIDGIVQVRGSVQEKAVGEIGILAGNSVDCGEKVEEESEDEFEEEIDEEEEEEEDEDLEYFDTFPS
nr:hypothetical protein [Tanacetum cinerariifolium]